MKMRTNLTRSLVVAVGLATVFSLSGCFPNPLDQLNEKIGEGLSEGGGGNSEGAEEKLIEGATGSEIEIETDGTMPEDFPADVPVIDGKIVSSVGIVIEDGKAWTVTLAVDNSKTAMNLAREKLVAAGFEETVWSDGSMMLGIFSTDTHSVTISNGHDDDVGQVITYQAFGQVTGK